ncbi:hypothetical protein PIB30_076636 [Stylosanthes scabra]|uniref:Uncharacterized protein n=1 Tax=Stylosanthes scabra TaxID=79078 RepID=A0ABU6RQ67_9FABA|nr:hypothetical protein [Stylosanthes scabra]
MESFGLCANTNRFTPTGDHSSQNNVNLNLNPYLDAKLNAYTKLSITPSSIQAQSIATRVGNVSREIPKLVGIDHQDPKHVKKTTRASRSRKPCVNRSSGSKVIANGTAGNVKGKMAVVSLPDQESGGFIIEEDMELYLLRVCTKLHFGCPRLDRYVYLSEDGEQHYRFSAKLACEEADINLEVTGCFSPHYKKITHKATLVLGNA